MASDTGGTGEFALHGNQRATFPIISAHKSWHAQVTMVLACQLSALLVWVIHSAMRAVLFVSFNAVLGVVPDKSLLDHVSTITTDKTKEQGTSDPPSVLSIGPGLPPVPRKLITHIQAGEFVDMAELLPDRMGITTTPSFLSHKNEKQPFKTKRRQVTNITEWVQCYSIYVAVLTSKYPDKIQDLMGYQALIIEACSEAWLGYDCRFRQMAAASPNTQ